MYRFCTFILLFLAVFSTGAFAQERKDPKAIYDQIKFLRSMQDVVRSGEDPVKRFFMPCVTDECTAPGRLTNDLSVRGETEPAAAFYAGLLNFEYAQSANERGEGWAKMVESSSKDARKQFAFASSAGIAAASWNMGVIYATNLGVAGSKLAAIEWYGRAGHQYLRDGERETALASLEKMETMDSKHPDSTRLRVALFPAPKKK